MGQAERQHLDWLARSFGRSDYRPLSNDDLEFVIRLGEAISKPARAHLFDEGDESRAVFIFERGEAEIYRGTGKGRRVVARTGPGSVLGDISIFQGAPYLASAQAVTQLRVRRIDKARLLPELAARPAMTLRWLVTAFRHLESSQRRLIELMHMPVTARVASLLADEAGPGSEVNLSQSTIAALLGVSRQSVNEALSSLRDDGVVSTGYRSVRILDPEALAEFAPG